ncbi:hypothetical protein [Burkholderia vietnamiensis]|uniref:hypothetical protein n=1 Tax=Burkholderia vietnamiensis TaxID=60552 RepID=UPI00158BB499
MKERPILFSGPMVRAILEGRKTQTRRIVKVRSEQPPAWATFAAEGHSPTYTSFSKPTGLFYWSEEQPNEGLQKTLRRWPIESPKHAMAGDHYWTPCPHGAPGDRLWVRETHDVNRLGIEDFPGGRRRYYAGIAYRADDGRHEADITERMYCTLDEKESRGWTPSIHMPRWASRITLEITRVRAERLQSISDADAEAEGVDFLRHVPDADETLDARGLFLCLWDGLNAARGHGWDANPWVWAIEFRRIEP